MDLTNNHVLTVRDVSVADRVEKLQHKKRRGYSEDDLKTLSNVLGRAVSDEWITGCLLDGKLPGERVHVTYDAGFDYKCYRLKAADVIVCRIEEALEYYLHLPSYGTLAFELSGTGDYHFDMVTAVAMLFERTHVYWINGVPWVVAYNKKYVSSRDELDISSARLFSGLHITMESMVSRLQKFLMRPKRRVAVSRLLSMLA